jgi:hypothetical protein
MTVLDLMHQILLATGFETSLHVRVSVAEHSALPQLQKLELLLLGQQKR